MITHVPVEGNPESVTLPVGTSFVGCTIVPITGAPGVAGCETITTFAEGGEEQSSDVVTV